MASVVVRRLVTPTEDEIHQAAAVLHAAFLQLNDSFGLSLTGGNPELDIEFHTVVLRAGAVGGEIWVAGFGPTDICAVAVWFGPGTDYLATEEQRAAGWNALQAKFTPELQKWWLEYFIPRYDAWNTSCLGEGTKLRSWYLHVLGTRPEDQRKGLSAALIQVIEFRAQADGVMMCLDTTNDPNVAFYRGRGFTVRDTISIVGSGGETIMTCLSK
ncbi:hypothetical protein C8F04DRAFT_1097681 [Mycena alexandri]|uniref:N-acetyltransferase domain-containing protein n=1 Tax=Mycena alexandri TaxID=1745969 RepID=A0AAD6SYT7_9AGAR|nr:hypothetical protein C8F04DRAFT_1097681 [Mycena alexandri]